VTVRGSPLYSRKMKDGVMEYTIGGRRREDVGQDCAWTSIDFSILFLTNLVHWSNLMVFSLCFTGEGLNWPLTLESPIKWYFFKEKKCYIVGVKIKIYIIFTILFVSLKNISIVCYNIWKCKMSIFFQNQSNFTKIIVRNLHSLM